MWPLHLVVVALQAFFTWSQCPSLSSSLPRSPWMDDSKYSSQSQALLQYDRVMSLYQTIPVLKDIDYAKDDLHGLDDDYLYGASALTSTTRSKSAHGTPSAQPEDQEGSHDSEHSSEDDAETHDEEHDEEPEENASEDRRAVMAKRLHGHLKAHRTFVHGRHEHDMHSAHTLPSTTSTVIALMLVGMMAMGMSLFYLVNYPDEDIQQVTWTILSSTISLFCAVLIFSALKAVMGMCLGERVGGHSHKADWTTVVFSFIHFILTFALNQLLVVLHREKNFPLKAWATIGGHITAFAGIEAFGNLWHNSFSGSWQQGFLLIVLAALVIWSLSVLASYLRTGLIPKTKEQQELFSEVCDDAGREYVALILGLLVSMLVRHMITGHLPPIHGSPRNKSQMEIWLLFFWSVGFMFALVLYSYMARETLRGSGKAGTKQSLAHLAQNVLSMCGGWCLLSWGQWLFWSSVGESMGETDKMQARMIMAIAFSAVVLSSIFIFDFIADHYATQSGLRALISTMALLLGLAWEAVFTLSIESISGHYIEYPAQYIWVELGLTLILCGVVLPAWVMYFLPKAEEGKFLAEEQCG